MDKILLLNAFSFNMLDEKIAKASVKMMKITKAGAQEIARGGFTSGVGHIDTAALFSSELGLDVPANRITVSLEKGANLLVGQYRGTRLPEGVKTLPEGATIEWMIVTIE